MLKRFLTARPISTLVQSIPYVHTWIEVIRVAVLCVGVFQPKPVFAVRYCRGFDCLSACSIISGESSWALAIYLDGKGAGQFVCKIIVPLCIGVFKHCFMPCTYRLTEQLTCTMAVAKLKVPDEPQYGGYEYEFVDKVPERCLCSIVCHKVLRDARLLVCCGNHVCESCLNRWLRSQEKLEQQEDQQQPLCPHCREENFTHVKNLALRREVDDLKIHCTNGEAGCTWEGALSDLKTHLESEKGCDYVEVHCTNKCKKQLKRKDLADHLTQHCPLRKYKCQHCGQEDTYQTITEKHYDECPNYPLDCPNTCGGRGIKRADMTQHRSKCPLEPVECPFQEAGCQATLVRRELDSHVTTNQQQHLLTLMAAFREVKAELSTSKTELREVKAEFSTTKEATKVMQEVIATDVAIIQQNEKQQSDLALASIKSQLKLDSFRLQHNGPPLTIRMINFSYYQQSGKVWHSPPFYYGAGYKMQLAVYANGTGAGESTHVSIALLLMKGEFDHQIPWPVRGKFRLLHTAKPQPPSPHTVPSPSHPHLIHTAKPQPPSPHTVPSPSHPHLIHSAMPQPPSPHTVPSPSHPHLIHTAKPQPPSPHTVPSPSHPHLIHTAKSQPPSPHTVPSPSHPHLIHSAMPQPPSPHTVPSPSHPHLIHIAKPQPPSPHTVPSPSHPHLIHTAKPQPPSPHTVPSPSHPHLIHSAMPQPPLPHTQYQAPATLTSYTAPSPPRFSSANFPSQEFVDHQTVQRVLEKEGVRELYRKKKFVTHRTVSKRLLNDSIVLKIEVYNTMEFYITLL